MDRKEILQSEPANDRRCAAYLGATAHLLRHWRGMGLGPPWLGVAGKVFYPIAPCP